MMATTTWLNNWASIVNFPMTWSVFHKLQIQAEPLPDRIELDIQKMKHHTWKKLPRVGH